MMFFNAEIVTDSFYSSPMRSSASKFSLDRLLLDEPLLRRLDFLSLLK